MGVRLLSPFSRMIDHMPAGAIVAAVGRQAQMLTDDVAHGRLSPDGETHSILSFCHFVEAVQLGVEISPVALPIADTAFYRKTTERLIEAGKLPRDAKEWFDIIFSRPSLELLSSVA